MSQGSKLKAMTLNNQDVNSLMINYDQRIQVSEDFEFMNDLANWSKVRMVGNQASNNQNQK